ncbi:MAG TPA: hypothetical protein PKJ99_12900 [Thermoanaerobaculales bacterium]|nr:hypothetical protein [Thermoanaerobaculales bacterium]HPA80207.1 hypothetical protein [Thermoanaerobaculales bacterium]HQN95757.1 hypothetical protein [Thermoanaerobaculales bacterium]HQP44546.1 hypothetical protein [Thermoanaerobaculales bacterium]
MAVKLGAAFRTTPEFWLNAQKAVDLYRAEKKLGKLPSPLLKASQGAGSATRGPPEERMHTLPAVLAFGSRDGARESAL